jgi:hypothetical protein
MIRWFKKAQRTENLAEENLTVQKSLALNLLLGQLREERKYLILDLGPAVGQNIEFFSQYDCRLYIEDLFDTLSSFDYFAPEDGFSYEAVFSYLLPFLKTTRFDVILAWDLFNYLEKDEFHHLILHLSKFSHKGTLLFGLVSTQRHIPDTPHIFRIADQDHLIYQVRSNVLRACPRYQGRELEKLLPSFRVCNSFILRNGFKEYIFACE